MKPGFLLALALSLALAACHKPDASAPGRGNPAASHSKPLKLAFITNNSADFWTVARAGCDAAIKKLPEVTLDFQILADGTAATQKRIVDDLLARGVDGIAISPIDPTDQTQMLDDAARQCLLITQDSDAPASDRACYIGTDNVAAGRMAGDLIKQALPAGGKIVLFVGTLDAQNAQERLRGIKEMLAGSKVEIIDLRTDDSDHVRAKANAADALVKYPEVSCLVGLWGSNGPAILNALRETGKVGAVKIVCFDEEDETIQGVRDGAIFGTVVQQPYRFGQQGIEIMHQYLEGDKSAIPAGKKIIIPTLAITKDNVEAFSSKLNRERGR